MHCIIISIQSKTVTSATVRCGCRVISIDCGYGVFYSPHIPTATRQPAQAM